MTAVHFPNERRLVRRIGELVPQFEAAGYDAVWFGEVSNVDAVVPATLAAAASERLEIGTLVNVFTRAPATIAMTAATLADVAPGRISLVLGTASALLVERWNGIAYERPFERLRETLRYVRTVLDGGRINGFALPQLPPESPRLLVAACGPRALELAATEADGVVLNWLSPDDLPRVEALPDDRSRVFMVTSVCPTDDRALVDTTVRPLMTDYLNVPGYADQQRRFGRGDALTPMWDAWAKGNRDEAQRRLPDEVIDELVVWGSPESCRARLAAVERATGVRAIASFLPPPGMKFVHCAF